MVLYKGFLENNRLVVEEEPSSQYKMRYDRERNRCEFWQGKKKRVLRKGQINTYKPVYLGKKWVMVFDPYHKLDVQKMQSVFAEHYIGRVLSAIEVLERDINKLELTIEELEKLL